MSGNMKTGNTSGKMAAGNRSGKMATGYASGKMPSGNASGKMKPGSGPKEDLPFLRRLFTHPAARWSGIVALVAAMAWAGWSIWTTVRPDPAIEAAETNLFMDSQTGQTFTVKVGPDMTIPMVSPYSGAATGYPCELCYWTKDGQIKTDPTPVILNSYLGKTGPTFCPDCGRLVVPHNPVPQEGSRPPPTEADYWATHPRPAPAN